MHLLSESNKWETNSEFVEPTGRISKAYGESEIIVDGDEIINRSWVMINGSKIENIYSIKKVNEQLYTYVSNNPSLGTQKGTFYVDRDTIYSKFVIENTNFDGFEVITYNKEKCDIYGALYKDGELINTWRGIMKKCGK